jgi:hypothetical protein
MTFRHLLLVAAIASLATAANAQTPSTAPGQSPPRERPAASKPQVASSEAIGDFSAEGDVSVKAVIGAKVRNADRETVGTVQDLYVDASGSIKTAVIAVGGFLGVGSKDVAVKWSDIKQTRDGNTAVLTTSLSKEQLKAMPDHRSSQPKSSLPK